MTGDASPLERHAAAGTITAAMLAAGRAYREDWLASVRLAKRANVANPRRPAGPRSWSPLSAAQDRYRKAGHALGPWRPLVMWLCCGAADRGPEGGYRVESVRYALAILVRFYRVEERPTSLTTGKRTM